MPAGSRGDPEPPPTLAHFACAIALVLVVLANR